MWGRPPTLHFNFRLVKLSLGSDEWINNEQGIILMEYSHTKKLMLK